MLNRRTLRIKVMQALYAYEQAIGSDYSLALDRISDAFQPDLNSMVPQDKRLLQGQQKMADATFREWHTAHVAGKPADIEKSDDKDVQDAVDDAVRYYQKQAQKETVFFMNQMLNATESIHDQYLHLLNLPAALLQVIEEEKSREARRFTASTDVLDTTRLERNPVLQKLAANKQLQEQTIRRTLQWAGENEMEALRLAWRNEMRNDEELRSYLAGESKIEGAATDYAAEQEILKYIYKTFVFKGTALAARLEEDDLNWEENRSIVKNLVVKTLKMLDEAADENLELLSLSANWKEDKEFAETLYKQTLAEDANYEALISGAVQNWDVERVALLDKIILKMALCEMHLFRSIPVKVTINEYIEISKLYSTPKSKQFINGILDKLAQDLMASGAIRKSGRGLLDNQ
ncbi:transcription antitermination factor NusB [Hymenobacter busanensis]|uniref:Transcription antitermination factor NusB n=1 Tax=Hymenobacter busanensis TaxID=2607656 RepID=A0A7L4ZYX2_9BACT|nr:transcription antitermination factor NusB [Hymenobacter busanensis]KAA9331287.1 transcription antitermination factor NusB [Hymenobacter busanensis]QHJ08438.1 transcription antitermination factor NusB [Hymenobacter busanensis]